MLNMDLLTTENIFDPRHTMFLKIYFLLLAVLIFFGNLIVCVIFCSNAIPQSSMNTWIFYLAIANMVQGSQKYVKESQKYAEKNSHSKASVRAAILTESIYISYIHQKHSRKIWQILLQTQLISA